jgi:polyvinyl alcohol dehydrogenase (cytochrome)
MGASDTRAPDLASLRSRTPQAIIESLVTGAMRVQGSRMSGVERRAVAEFASGKAINGDVTGSESGRCSTTATLSDGGNAPRWSGWSPAANNARLQPADQAGLTLTDVPRLKLRWAFGFPDASVAWSQPTVASGRVFVGSQNGTVYSLDAKTGCIRWTFGAGGGVRTAVVIGPQDGGSPVLVYFGDTAGNVYALDADTGRQRWVRRIDEHPLARITGSPTLYNGRLYVPVSSYEEAQGADPQYACCTFRGSVSALDAATGTVVWKTYLIADSPKRRGTSTAGVPLWGPSGAAVWSAPTVDAERRRLYVATGNSYSAPAVASSNAVVALDLETGAIRWTRQVTPNDIYVSNCSSGGGNPNCPETNGPDFDFGSPPVLARTVAGRDIIVIGQKSGMGYAMDPDKEGAIIWQYRAGQGGVLGGIEWGAAADSERVYFAVSDITQPRPGGLHAVSLATGERVWVAQPAVPTCATGRGCNAAQSAAITIIPGAVLSGSVDGSLRIYSIASGEIVWQFDTNREFPTVNGVPARGASMLGPGPAVAGGMVFVSSGYGAFLGRPGNVLLAFGAE